MIGWRQLVGPPRRAAVLFAVVVVLTALGGLRYPGSPALLLGYGAVVGLLLCVSCFGTGSFFTRCLCIFLTLGCWAKLVLHLLFETVLIEPVGQFDGSAASWDSVVAALLVAFLALLLCAALLTRRRGRAADEVLQGPGLRDTLMPLLGVAIGWTLGILSLNHQYAILKIGTEPILKLHSYLYVFLSFMIAWGNMILLGTLWYWLVVRRMVGAASLFYLFGITGALTTISMGSRAQMVLYVIAACLVYAVRVHGRHGVIRARQWLRIGVTLGLLFVLSIMAVSADRLSAFASARPVVPTVAAHAGVPAVSPGALSTPAAAEDPVASLVPAAPAMAPDPTGSASAAATVDLQAEADEPHAQLRSAEVPLAQALSEADAQARQAETAAALRAYQWHGMLRQLSKLVVDRWIGLEGVMAVTGHAPRDAVLVGALLREDPARGVDAIYQRMSQARYPAYENFTFMTIPGPIALLYCSGSLLVVALGMAALFLGGWALETLAERLLRNAAASATIGVALAYLLVQANFPKVLGFFALEVGLFVLGLAVVRWFVARRARPITAL